MKMKKMMMLLMTIGMMGVMTVKASGEDGDACKRIKKIDKWMHDSLYLNPTQGSRITEINNAACTKLQDAWTKAGGDKEKFKPEAKEVMQSVRKEYASVLSYEQMEKLKAKAKANPHTKGLKDPQKRAARITEKMKTELNLTSDQTPKVQVANEAFCQKMQTIHEKKESGVAESTIKTEMKEAVKIHNESMKSILNTEQLAKWEQLKKAAREERKKRKAEEKK